MDAECRWDEVACREIHVYSELFLGCEKLEKFTWTRISVLCLGYANHYTTQISYYVIIFTCIPSVFTELFQKDLVENSSYEPSGKLSGVFHINTLASNISVYDQDNLVQLLGLFNMI
jgi:hypothetical protein